MSQFKVWKTKEYCMYFSFFKLKKWGKKAAETRRHNCAVLPKRKPERNQAGERMGGRCRRHFPRTLAVSTISDATFYAHCAVDLLRKIEYSFFRGKCEENNPLSTPLVFSRLSGNDSNWRTREHTRVCSRSVRPYGKRFPVCGISQRIYNIKEEM